MQFANPALLAGVALFAVPLVIHLLNRQRHKKRPWAAMEFLLRAYQKTRNRLRNENLLLLLLRCLIPIVLAFAIARPVLQHSATLLGQQGGTHHVFVLDQSYSMGYSRDGAQSPFDKGRQLGLRLLERLARVAEEQWPALKPYRPRLLVREFGRSLKREIDLANEGHNAERIAANLAGFPELTIPRVHWAYTGARLNVQDFIDGVPAEDLERLTREGFNRHLLAQRGARIVMKMIVEDGFFHADPHPGNLFYLPGNRIALIDFGMVGRIPPRRREELLTLLLGLVERRPQAVADVLLDWTGGVAHDGGGGRSGNGVQLGALEDEIEAFVDRYHGTPLAQLNLGDMLVEVTGVLREHHLALPSDLALLIKAFITLEGAGRALDPKR